jgi:hypothetical protein
MNVYQQRLRCLGHVINLTVKVMLVGVDIASAINDVLTPVSGMKKTASRSKATITADSDVSSPSLELEIKLASFEKLVSQQNDELRQKAWRKKGAAGKAHNLVVHINYSPQRRQVFEEAQKEADGEAVKLFKLIPDGGIRWNSSEEMYTRLIKLRTAVDLYCLKHRLNTGEDLPDALTPEDWQDLINLVELLKPFKDITKMLEGNAVKGSQGALWEWLPGVELLLTHLESKKKELEHQDDTHFKACVEAGWQKLNEYYSLSDRTGAYRSAIILHPAKKLKWFNKHWSEKQSWISSAEVKVRQLYEEQVKQLLPVPTPTQAPALEKQDANTTREASA